MPHNEELEMANWGLTLGRQGLEIRAGRHLRLSVSLALLSWLLSISGAVTTSALWGVPLLR